MTWIVTVVVAVIAVVGFVLLLRTKKALGSANQEVHRLMDLVRSISEEAGNCNVRLQSALEQVSAGSRLIEELRTQLTAVNHAYDLAAADVAGLRERLGKVLVEVSRRVAWIEHHGPFTNGGNQNLSMTNCLGRLRRLSHGSDVWNEHAIEVVVGRRDKKGHGKDRVRTKIA